MATISTEFAVRTVKSFLVATTLVAISVAMVGCATKEGSTSSLNMEDRSNLVVVRTGTEVKMSWESEPDRTYTILHSNRRNAPGNRWKPLRDYTNIRGTGGTMRATDEVPRGVERYYRLRSAEQ